MIDYYTNYGCLNHENGFKGDLELFGYNFVKANDKTSNLLIPKKEKLKIKIISEDTRIIDARDKVNVAFSIYSKTPTDSNQDTLRHAKQKLQSEYDNIESEELDRDIQVIEQISYPNTQPVGN